MNNPNNLFPDETIGTQSTELYPPMEELPLKPPPQQYPVQTPPANEVNHQAEPLEEVAESPETRQEVALTIRFAIAKLNDYLLWFMCVLEITLILRFMLKLICADPNNLFPGFLYAFRELFNIPF